MMKRFYRLASFLLMFLPALRGGAQTSYPMLGSVFPMGVERGKTALVTVRAGGNGGANLYGAYKVLFGGDGVTGEIVPPEKGWPAKDPKNPMALPNVDTVQVRITIAANATLGIREMRIVSPRMGISTIAPIIISDTPELTETEPNNDIEHASSAALPCVVNGRFQNGEDVDSFKFKASAGQEIVFTAQCARMQDKIHDMNDHADPLLVLREMSGKALAQNDDYYRADPLLHYKFDRDGEYVLQIRDVNYKGSAHWAYRLTMTTRPYVTAVLPCAVQPGKTAELHITGYNLNGVQTVNFTAPADTPRGLVRMPLVLPNGTANLVSLLITDAPQTVVESKATGAKAVPAALGKANLSVTAKMNLPGGVNSILLNERQIDRYAFTVKKGEAWRFEVASRRLDSEMDSEIKLRNAKGETLAANDDAGRETKDSRLEWTAPEDGTYTIEIRDLTGHAGPTLFYNLTMQTLHPEFRLKCDCDRAMLAPGSCTVWYVLADRKNGFAGPIDVRVEGLPAGVSAAPFTIPANMSVGTLFLTAAGDAKIDAALVRVIGTAKVGSETVTQNAHPVTEIYIPGGGRGLIESDTQGVAVTEENDIVASANMQAVTLKPGESVKIEITIKRRSDFTKNVTLDALLQAQGQQFVNPLPPGITIEGATIGEKDSKGTITLKAANDAKPIDNLPIAITANVAINFVMKVWFAAPPILLTVTAPPPAKK